MLGGWLYEQLARYRRGTENLGSHLGGPPQARLRSSATDPNIIAPT